MQRSNIGVAEPRKLTAVEAAEAAGLEAKAFVDKAIARQKWRSEVGLAPGSPSTVIQQGETSDTTSSTLLHRSKKGAWLPHTSWGCERSKPRNETRWGVPACRTGTIS